MRKGVLLLIFSFSFCLSFGQVKVYPKIGTVISSQHLHFGSNERTDWQVQNKLGFAAGVGVETQLYPRVAVSGDLQFAQLGYIDLYKTQWQEWEEVYNTNYLLLPLSLKYTVVNGTLSKVFLAAGPYGGMFLSGTHTSTHNEKYLGYVSTSKQKFKVNDDYKYDRFDWGFQFGGGLNFMIGKNEFMLETKYAIGMPNIHEIHYWQWARGTTEVGSDGKNQFFAISLACALPTWKQKPNTE